MTRCKEFYEKFGKEGNFCEKNYSIATAILNYYSYCERHGLEKGEINHHAIEPFMIIEGEPIHEMALAELKEKLNTKQIKPKQVTRVFTKKIIKSVEERYLGSNKNEIRSPAMQKLVNENFHIVRVSLSSIIKIEYFCELFNMKQKDLVNLMVKFCGKNKEFIKYVKKYHEEE